MERRYYCFECDTEYFAEELEVCKYCETEDVMDTTEHIEAEEFFAELEEGPTDEDCYEWMYGNDYHRYIK